MNVSHWSDLPLVLTAKQAAAVLQLKPRTVAHMLDRGDLQGIKVGKEWRISRAEVMRFVLGRPGVSKEVPAAGEPAPVVMDEGGILVVQTEPLDGLTEFINQERERRLLTLLDQVVA